MTNFFQEAIPIRELIKVPLTSAMEADYDLAASTIKFIEEFGHKKTDELYFFFKFANYFDNTLIFN